MSFLGCRFLSWPAAVHPAASSTAVGLALPILAAARPALAALAELAVAALLAAPEITLRTAEIASALEAAGRPAEVASALEAARWRSAWTGRVASNCDIAAAGLILLRQSPKHFLDGQEPVAVAVHILEVL